MLLKEFERLGQKSKTKSKPGRLDRDKVQKLHKAISTLVQSGEPNYSLQPQRAETAAPVSISEGIVAMSLGNKELEQQISKELKKESDSNPLRISNLFDSQ